MNEKALTDLLALKHGNPHALLGAHPTGTDVFVRVMRPNAKKVEVLALGQRVPLRARTDFPGIFEGRLPMREVPPYMLEVHYPDGNVFTLRDPYAFLPTLGDHDLHFVGEGTHRRVWDRLGAHPPSPRRRGRHRVRGLGTERGRRVGGW
jgi:1,4-alpha-glucan branching enzyme